MNQPPIAGHSPSGGTPAADVAPGVDAARSACVLIGVSRYDSDELRNLPQVADNLQNLKSLLTSPAVWGIPEDHCWTLGDAESTQQVATAIHKAARTASDTLLVYYAGHGLLEASDGRLALGLTESQHGWSGTSLPLADLQQILASVHGGMSRQVLILDCCYSGDALRKAPGAVQPAAEGDFILMSSGPRQASKSIRGARHTLFTGALIDVLRTGDPTHPSAPYLSLNRVSELLIKRLPESDPKPQTQTNNSFGDLPFLHNAAAAAPPSAASPPTPPVGRRRSAMAATGVAGLMLGTVIGCQAHEDIERMLPASRFPGPCGEDSGADLLSVSEALEETDNNAVHGARVEGISDIALAGSGQTAYLVRDNHPAQFFTVDLGPPEALDPRVLDVQSLYDGDGAPLAPFDAEAVHVEEGGGTILVAGEHGPSIERFEVDGGTRSGDPLPVPGEFRPAPDGHAHAGRTIESLAASADGRFLFAGVEDSLATDTDVHGHHLVRIQRYQGEAGGDYTPDVQYGYQTEEGHYLVELAVHGERLLALERGFLSGIGNGIRVYDVDLDTASDVAGEPLDGGAADLLPRKKLLFDLASCPEGPIRSDQPQPNHLIDNVEGMALGPTVPEGEYAGRRLLYLVSDDNAQDAQHTRVYALAVTLPSPPES